MKAWGGEEFVLEDERAARDVLHRRYAAVVGNPPYITVKDGVLRERYKELYSSCFREFTLATPFTERFFHLARAGGFVGLITENGFMKRERGKKLIQEFLPTVNLDGVVNLSGAYIPGHGTPTVLLFGTNEPRLGEDVLTVLAKRGEPSTPEDPERGQVWQSIVEHDRQVGFEDDFIGIARLPRTTLDKHPWSLGGGDAAELKDLLERRAAHRLTDLVDCIGFSVITGEDNVLMGPREAFARKGVRAHVRRNVIGEEIRDWSVADGDWCIWPNSPTGERLLVGEIGDVLQYLWPWRAVLRGRKAFGVPVEEKGIPWWALREVYAQRMKTPFTIAFAEVATHNHFVLDRGGKVFKQTAPIIKLSEASTEEEHLALLAYLNSSTACFWMKQVAFMKANHTEERPERFVPGTLRYAFAGTQLGAMPVPSKAVWTELARFGREILAVPDEVGARSPSEIAASILSGADPSSAVAAGVAADAEVTERRVALQEDLDWACYRIFGLASDEAGQRMFSASGRLPVERRMFLDARRVADAAPAVWDARLREVASTSMSMLENAENKRRWVGIGRGSFAREARTFEERCYEAVTSLLLRMCESSIAANTVTSTLHRCVSHLLSGEDTRRALDWVADQRQAALWLQESMAAEAVPFSAVYRHTPAGLEKCAQWEHVWELQRAEDLGEQVPPFDPPPRYDQADYRDPIYWRLRGKLDVPRERFISYPGCESDEDKEPVYGWAGWNHLQQAQALAALYQKRKVDEAWGKDRLTPMLAGLLELIPWVKQWHNEPSEEFGGLRLGDYFEAFVDGECQQLGLTRDELRAWRPPEKGRGRGAQAKSRKAASEAEEGDAAPVPPKRRRAGKKGAPDESGEER
jgi:hypothetical protein